MRALCILLHLVLVIAHIVLVIIWSLRLEHNVVVSLARSGTVSTAIVVVAQALSVVRPRLIILIKSKIHNG